MISPSLLVALMALSLPFTLVLVDAGDGVYSYDPVSGTVGPWNAINLDLNDASNQCGGDRGSPIAVKSSTCTTFDDYELNVSACRV